MLSGVGKAPYSLGGRDRALGKAIWDSLPRLQVHLSLDQTTRFWNLSYRYMIYYVWEHKETQGHRHRGTIV